MCAMNNDCQSAVPSTSLVDPGNKVKALCAIMEIVYKWQQIRPVETFCRTHDA